VFTKDKGAPGAPGAGPYIAYYITNEKCNVWDVTKHGDASAMTGGKKRKTNRRKHRRSNRKTLGRKK
jgi:hypothetical protein